MREALCIVDRKVDKAFEKLTVRKADSYDWLCGK